MGIQWAERKPAWKKKDGNKADETPSQPRRSSPTAARRAVKLETHPSPHEERGRPKSGPLCYCNYSMRLSDAKVFVLGWWWGSRERKADSTQKFSPGLVHIHHPTPAPQQERRGHPSRACLLLLYTSSPPILLAGVPKSAHPSSRASHENICNRTPDACLFRPAAPDHPLLVFRGGGWTTRGSSRGPGGCGRENPALRLLRGTEGALRGSWQIGQWEGGDKGNCFYSPSARATVGLELLRWAHP